MSPQVYQKTSENPIPVNIRGVPTSNPAQILANNPSNPPYFRGPQSQPSPKIANQNGFGYPQPYPIQQGSSGQRRQNTQYVVKH